MSVTADRSTERLDIGQALQDVLTVVGRNLGPFALLGVALAGLPAALLNLGNALAPSNPGFALLGILGLAATFIGRPILYGALIFATTRDLNGEPASLRECLTAGRRRWGALLVLMIRSGLLVGLGVVLLVVPGLYLALRWAAAAPVLVLSGRSVSDSMNESARLTKGRRWAMLLLYLIVLIALICAGALPAVVQGALLFVAPKLLVVVLIDPLVTICIDVAFAVVAAVLFRRLRGDVEGGSTVALAEVFA
jgi:Membrane domain of glycerophosphoryl diester phosphodiesterase